MLLVPKEGNIETSYDHLRDSWVDFLLVRYHYLKNENTSYIYEGFKYIIKITQKSSADNIIYITVELGSEDARRENNNNHFRNNLLTGFLTHIL